MTDKASEKKDKNIQKSGEQEKEIGEEIFDAEVMKDLPPKVKEMMIQITSMQHGIPPGPPRQLLEKITSEHITKSIDLTAKEDERHYEYAKSGRMYTFAYVVIALLAFFGLALLLLFVARDIDLFKEIVKTLLIFAAGIGAGYGLKSYKVQKR